MSIRYDAPPTCAAFMKSDAFGRLIAGPVGSGKTTACIIELLRRAALQGSALDGFRYTRFAIVRQTLKQLKDTVLKDVQSWCADIGEWRVSENTFHLKFGDVRSEWLFIPLEDEADQKRLLSMQLTGAWLSEAIEMDFSVVAPLSGRITRYPSGPLGTPTWSGIIADTNFPTEMTPWHKHMEEPPSGWQIFKQPSGLSPDAENLNYLNQNAETIKLPVDHPVRLAAGRKYYERYVETYGEAHPWVNRYVKAQYGDDPSGMAVFKATFNRNYHVVPHTQVIPGYPLLVGQDFGRNPWSLICQIDHRGRLLVHREVPGTNVGLEKHCEQSLKPCLWNEFTGMRLVVIGDPSGVARGQIGEESCFECLTRMGLPSFNPEVNDIEPRLRAVEAQFLKHDGTGAPALLIDGERCPMLVRALAGGYRFKKTKEGALKPVPEKNDPEGFSHVVDCLQYVCLCMNGGAMPYLYQVLSPPRVATRPPMDPGGWT